MSHKLPPLLLGTERLGSVLFSGGGTARADTFRFFDQARDLGLSAFDLAASYQLGGTERLLGAWLAARGGRQNVFLLSKGGHPTPVLAPNRLTPKDLTSDLHASLKRLQTDFLDLYLLHRDHPNADLPVLARTLSAHQKSGKIRAWGVSNWEHQRVAHLDAVVRQQTGSGIAASSPQFSLACWSTPLWSNCVSISGLPGANARAFHAQTQLPVIAYSALGRGLFSDDPYQSAPGEFRNSTSLARQERAGALGARLGLDVAAVALAYLVSQPFPVHPVISTKNVRHLTANLAAVKLRLTTEQVYWLESGGTMPEGAL